MKQKEIDSTLTLNFMKERKFLKENILKLIDVAKNNLEDIRVTKYKEQKNGSGEKEPEPRRI